MENEQEVFLCSQFVSFFLSPPPPLSLLFLSLIHRCARIAFDKRKFAEHVHQHNRNDQGKLLTLKLMQLVTQNLVRGNIATRALGKFIATLIGRVS